MNAESVAEVISAMYAIFTTNRVVSVANARNVLFVMIC